MKTLHIIAKGRVQGVGFRAKVQHYATKYGIKGVVKNLCDGTVEIYAQGESDDLLAFEKDLINDPGLAKIERLIVEECTLHKTFESFQILFN